MRRLTCIAVLLMALPPLASPLFAGEKIPPSPQHFFNDYANVTSQATRDALEARLELFERESSNQIVVAIYPRMETDSSIEDFAQHIFDAWKPGRANLDNGALLLVFTGDHKMRIHSGYGLEGALPDALCKRILDDELTPRFRAGNFDGGLTAAVDAMIAATRGEYKGTGQTVGGSGRKHISIVPYLFMAFIILLNFRIRRATVYDKKGRRYVKRWALSFEPGSGSSSGGGWSSGGGGGGGFSGGGGSSGGGGASGSW
jgi:uncharacterized protein